MKTKSETFQYGSKIEPIVPGPGLKRQVLGYDRQLMAVKVSFEKGAVGTQHAHYHSQVTYIVSGKFELCIGGKTAVLGAGDGYYVAPDELHGCTCLEDGVLIDTFSPMRADFLEP